MLFGIVSPEEPSLAAELGLPGMLSYLAYGSPDRAVKALDEFPPDEVPRGAELWITFVSFHNMVILGAWFIGLLALGLLLLWRRKLFDRRWYLWALVLSTPLPLAACQFGWATAEVGRQPWIVYGLLRTEDAVSVSVPAEQVLASISMFGVIYLMLGALWVFLLKKKLDAGPGEAMSTEEVA
jgi:cytochrome d ubiquinol oxidase subunit I